LDLLWQKGIIRALGKIYAFEDSAVVTNEEDEERKYRHVDD
jgi:hypothetical protein